MKINKVLTVLVFIVLLFCLIPINISHSNINNDSNIKTSITPTINTVDYIIDKDNITDSFDYRNMNLRHNDIITENYNGSYSFDDDNIDDIGIEINFIDLDVNNVSSLESNIDNHNTVLKYNNSVLWEVAYHNLNDISYGTIELWIRLYQTNIASVLRIRDGTPDSSITLEFRETAQLTYYDGSYYFISDYNSNQWYHIRIDFQCGIGGYEGLNSQWKIYIDDIEYGNYPFWTAGGNPVEMDDFEIIANINAIMYYDAIGFSWLDNYTINENRYPNIETVDSNILSKDKYEFNLNNNGNPYAKIGFPDVDFFDRQSPYSFFVYPDIPHFYMDTKNINGIKILADYEGLATGIKNESLGIQNDKINITFGFQYLKTTEINSDIYFILYSYNNSEIIKLRLDTQTSYKTNLDYYNGVDYTNLDTIYRIDNTSKVFNFNLFINNYTVNLKWYENDIYNNSFSFPLIFNLLGINKLYFYAYDNIENSNYFHLRLNYIGIYQHNISLSREKGYLSYSLDNDWSFNYYNLFTVISNQSIKILSYGRITLDNQFYIFREFDNCSFFMNLYGISKIIENPYLFIIIDAFYNISDLIDISIYGILLNEYYNDVYVKYYTASYSFINTNGNVSYFYVDTINRLNYKLYLQTNDTLEQISIGFDIDNRYTDNASFFMKGRETLTCFGSSFFTIIYSGLVFPTFIKLDTFLENFFISIPSARVFNNFIFTVNDYQTNNSFTDYTSEGYIYDISLVYNYVYIPLLIPEITIITLSLIAIIIPLIMILAPTFIIYGAIKKKEVILPVLLLMSIICFMTDLIPLELFFILSISMILGIFLQYKTKERFD